MVLLRDLTGKFPNATIYVGGPRVVGRAVKVPQRTIRTMAKSGADTTCLEIDVMTDDAK